MTAFAAFLGAEVRPAAAVEIEFRWTFEGLDGATNPTTADLPSALVSNAVAGFRQWTRWCSPESPRSIEVVLRIQSYPTGTGGGSSVTSAFVRNSHGLDIFEEGVAAEVRTGIDPNGGDPDMIVTIDPAYLRDWLWFDPDPQLRQAAITGERVDAVSFFAHEFGHVLAFNGWGNTADGSYPGNYRSRFDAMTRWDGAHWYYSGSTARALYGSDVPLSSISNTRTHYGNPQSSAAPGRDPVLIDGLMNGVAFRVRQRYSVGLLDLAFLRDQEIALDPAIRFTAPELRLSIVGGRQTRVDWLATPLARYRVEASSRADGFWQEATVDSGSGLTAAPRFYEEPMAASLARFYRLRLMP
ncbi:MAG: hypothetical protein JNK85_20835 [Verrucomicrobiales bacterium]|nr:hypothetical protein [Verrucomicrobiales bacterium]